MAEPFSNISISSSGQPNGTQMRAGMLTEPTCPTSAELGSRSSWTRGVPCGACKMLRRRCVNGCVFAPYFSLEQGPALFAAVHYVFGASNVSKLLMQLPVHHRYNAVQTICYEAQARLADPVYGCVSAIIGLQKQVQALQTEIAMVQQQIINKQLTVTDTLQGSLQQPEPVNQLELQPGHRHKLPSVYPNGLYAENNSIPTMDIYDCGLHNPSNFRQTAVYSDPNFDPLQPCCKTADDDEEESRDLFMFGVQNDLN